MSFVRAAFLIVALMLGGLLAQQPRPAFADFHCMRIHAVMGSAAAGSNVQYVELRMSLLAQNFIGGHKIRFYDASNVLKATFTFPGNLFANALNGESILIGTQEFNAATAGGDADFTFSMANTVGSNGGDPLHPVQSPGGKVVFAGEVGDFDCNFNPPPVDSVGYGAYTGPIDFGTGPAPGLANPGNTVLRLGTLTLKPSNNATEYSLQLASSTTYSVPSGNLKTDLGTPRNNARIVLQLPSAVGGVVRPPDIAGTAAQASRDEGTSYGGLVVLATVAAVAVTLAGGILFFKRR
ncbi:MAG: hypothetical protein WEE64_12255 [Dehalococcoidia bacterium]